MNSYCLGQIKLDLNTLSTDLKKLEQTVFDEAYDEYAFGTWKTLMLWNQSGNPKDTIISNYDNVAKPTKIGKQFDLINVIIRKYFNTKHLKFVRIMLAKNYGLVIPHVDYIELKKPFCRLHIPLKTNRNCMNSEGNSVFHMGLAQVWYLDASKVHSAACFAQESRYHLVLDFDSGLPIEQMITQKLKKTRKQDVYYIKRDSLTPQFLNTLMKLSEIINPDNFRNIVAILSSVHFRKEVDAENMFGWLIDISKKSNYHELIKKAEYLYKECIIRREMLGK